MKKIYKEVLAAFALTGLTSEGTAQPQFSSEAKPANVVIFIADDLGAHDIGPYGNRVVRTPNLDRLASESLVFSEAFASSPTCSPSRASIYTGLFPFRNGAHANHTGIRDNVQTLPVYMKSLGYRVGLAGKLHVGPMELYPFELIHNTNVPEPGYENKGVLWTDLIMEPVDEWLAEVSGKKDPFVLIVNDHSPHVVWPENPEYNPSEADIPDRHINTEDTRKSRARYYTDITKMDGNVGKLMKSLEKHGLDENTVVVFTADQGPQWAFGKWNLYDYGIQVPLMVKWPGVVKGGKTANALVSLVDIVPTVIEIAGGEAPSQPEAIDGESLVPLLQGKRFFHRDTIFASHTGDGTMNRAPMRAIRTERYKYILNLAPEIVYNTHMNKAKDHDGGREYWSSWEKRSYQTEHSASVLWRYHNRPAEELFDVNKDPDETVNLAADPLYAEIMEKFRTEMGRWREQQSDYETGPYQEPESIKIGVAPYIFK
jgi:uncharacterized sulfatase